MGIKGERGERGGDTLMVVVGVGGAGDGGGRMEMGGKEGVAGLINIEKSGSFVWAPSADVEWGDFRGYV